MPASRAWLVSQGMVAGPQSDLCCSAEVEDDSHILADCPAMGTPDWQLLVADAWCSVRHPLLALEDRQHHLSRLIIMPAS